LLTYRNLLKSIYSAYEDGGPDTINDVELEFCDSFDKDFFSMHSELMVSDYEKKLRYLNGNYTFTLKDGTYHFTKGCLKTLTSEGELQFRDRSEWFRKLPTDILFCQRLIGKDRLMIKIPRLWIRAQELPVMHLWSVMNRVPFLERHKKRVVELLDRYPLEEVIKNRHSITRRYFIRYYYIKGDIEYNTYKKHKSKTAKQMSANPELLVL